MSIVGWLPSARLIPTKDIPSNSPRSRLTNRALRSIPVAPFLTAGVGEVCGGNKADQREWAVVAASDSDDQHREEKSGEDLTHHHSILFSAEDEGYPASELMHAQSGVE
jgi:hypothetical protein